MTSAQKNPFTLNDMLAAFCAGAGLAAGVIFTLLSPEHEMRLHGAVLAGAGALVFLIAGLSGRASLPYKNGSVLATGIAALVWGAVFLLVRQRLIGADALSHQPSPPLSALIFVSGGNALLAVSFAAVQRTCRASLSGRLAPWFAVIGFNATIIMTGIGIFQVIDGEKEYSEPMWYVDMWLTSVWVVYFAVLIGTIFKSRKPPSFAGQAVNASLLFIVFALGLQHVMNNMAWPVSFMGTKSYMIYAGVQDAVTQWWYGHWR